MKPRLVFIDLETGGLNPLVHPITQIAAVAVDRDLEPIEEFEAKLTFDKATADPQALALSSYNEDVWNKQARSPFEIISRLSAFLKRFCDVSMVSKKGSSYTVAQLAGYNADSFDGPFLQNLYKQQNAFLPTAFRVLDVLQRVRWHFYESPNVPPADFKLTTVCSYLGIELDGAHDALADVRATVKVYKKLVQLLRDAS